MDRDPLVVQAERLLEWFEWEEDQAVALRGFTTQLIILFEDQRQIVIPHHLEASDRIASAQQHIKILRGIIEPPKEGKSG